MDLDRILNDASKVNTTIGKVEQALVAFGPQIAMGEMLVNLGIVAVEKIHGYFASKVSDDQILAGITSEFNARIARRS